MLPTRLVLPPSLARTALRATPTSGRPPALAGFHTARAVSTPAQGSHDSQEAQQLSHQASPEPTRSFQTHHKDAQEQWQHSRPHEAWTMSHPVYSPEELKVDVVHFKPKTIGDKVAYFMVRAARRGFDLVSGYKHASPEAARAQAVKDGKGDLSAKELVKHGYLMTEREWMARVLFLESIAGVPGFTAGMLRHLRSLRLMKRDGGWINSLLQEAENERMHLLTFMKIRQPTAFFRLLVLGAQGVATNLFFLTYLFSPRACHRFVGYLEEEACVTYTHLLGAIERGEIPEWDPKNPEGKKVPQVAKDYWRLKDDATMYDLVAAVRADEAGHRFTNHTFANLQTDDANPVAMRHATPMIQGTTTGFTREESLAWARQVQEEMTGKKVDEKEKPVREQ
ncbi:hypothetical protein JCM10213_009005 [Rhodosporidiobolus nylandii]